VQAIFSKIRIFFTAHSAFWPIAFKKCKKNLIKQIRVLKNMSETRFFNKD
jgi:hypothetical protein